MFGGKGDDLIDYVALAPEFAHEVKGEVLVGYLLLNSFSAVLSTR